MTTEMNVMTTELLVAARVKRDASHAVLLSTPIWTGGAILGTGGFIGPQGFVYPLTASAAFKSGETKLTHVAFDQKLKTSQGDEKKRLESLNKKARWNRWIGNGIYGLGLAASGVLLGVTAIEAISVVGWLALIPTLEAASLAAPAAYAVRGRFISKENDQYREGLADELQSLPKRRGLLRKPLEWMDK